MLCKQHLQYYVMVDKYFLKGSMDHKFAVTFHLLTVTGTHNEKDLSAKKWHGSVHL